MCEHLWYNTLSALRSSRRAVVAIMSRILYSRSFFPAFYPLSLTYPAPALPLFTHSRFRTCKNVARILFQVNGTTGLECIGCRRICVINFTLAKSGCYLQCGASVNTTSAPLAHHPIGDLSLLTVTAAAVHSQLMGWRWASVRHWCRQWGDTLAN